MGAPSLSARVASRMRRRGLADVAFTAVMGTVGRVMAPAYHRIDTPPLHTMHDSGHGVYMSAAEIFEQFSSISGGRLSPEIFLEYEHDLAELEKAYEQLHDVGLPDPLRYSLGREASALMYWLVRLLRPRTVVETGVALGHSTFLILRALDWNGTGTLHSIDVRPSVGSLLKGENQDRWTFHHAGSNPQRFLADLLGDLPPIDLFLHDSDHSYSNQLWEYRQVYPNLAPTGVLASDDVDKSHAFLDFARQHDLPPMFLVDRWKVFGLVTRSAA